MRFLSESDGNSKVVLRGYDFVGLNWEIMVKISKKMRWFLEFMVVD